MGEGEMGIFEKAKNITDTDLRVMLEDSSEPAQTLRRHILSLEESQRQLKSSQGFLERQRAWLEASAERKLRLAEEWEGRAASAARQSRDDLARHALLRKKELLRSMGDDRAQLEHILPQLAELDGRLGEVRQKILKAKSVRARFFDGETTATTPAPGDVDAQTPHDPASPPPASDDSRRLTESERQELDDELADLKRRMGRKEKSGDPP
jgi:phage shock protein A